MPQTNNTRIYLDNAATTPLDETVLEAMLPFYREVFGNPSSIHAFGREAKVQIEKARKKIAELFQVSPAEIFFTSGGTEADNTVLCGTIQNYAIKRAVTSRLEHHAVLHTLENLHKIGRLQQLEFVNIDEKGHIDLAHLETLLKDQPNTLVSLMHGNNEIGNLTDIAAVGEICKANNAFFHSDTVQTIGHYAHNLSKLPVHFVVGSAHKFHGPKGVGFLYVNHDVKIPPFIQGGSQERNMRGGTENIAGIVGMATALELAYKDMEKHRQHITNLKKRMIAGLTKRIEGVAFNGDSANIEKSLYTVLNVCLPPSELNEMLIFNLDIHKIAASAGSACSSGTNIGSHVLQAIKTNPDCGSVRFSFSRMNTEAEIDHVVNTLAQLLKK